MTTDYDSGDSNLAPISFTRSGEAHQSASSTSDQEYDFLDFLRVAQSLQIDFLPITWQPAMDKVGEGGTAKIRQALINVQMTFAFKHLMHPRSSMEESRNLHALIAEISILGHPVVRYHPCVADILGICWDVIDSGEQVWPVLVFEKTSCGDLHRFMTSGPGKELGLKNRLDLLFDVALAVRDLHTIGVIHGDIKPENILIFPENEGRYVAKVIDFGYSTLFATEKDLIIMPDSGLWTAPEQHHREILPRQARKMDTYSFGILCLWLLFYNKGTNPRCNFKKDLEDSQTRLSDFTFELLRATSDLENWEKDDMQKVFRLTLTQDPVERTGNFDELLELLSPYRAICLASPVDNISIPERDFLLALSLDQLIEAHYGVRYHIARCLEKRRDQHSTSRFHILNLAFCYELGFGVQRDIVKWSRFLLTTQGITVFDFEAYENVLDVLRQNPHPDPYQDGIFRKCFEQGYLHVVYFDQQYREEQRSSEAERCYQREVMTMGSMLGNGHPIIQQLRLQLCSIMSSEGRWKDAEELQLQMIELEESTLNDDLYSGRFIMYLENLAITYCDQRRWKEAEELEVQVMEKRKKRFKTDHPLLLRSQFILAMVYEHQKRLGKAEELNAQVMEARIRVSGTEHPETLASMLNLASTYSAQKRWKRAEELLVQVLQKYKRVLGAEHQATLLSTDHLAFTYAMQEQWKEAEKLQTQLVETTRKVLRADHPDILSRIDDLAWIYRHRNQWKDSEKLRVEAVEMSEKVLGADHPDTLKRIDKLVGLYRHQEQWEGARKLQVQLIEMSKKVCGVDHPDTLYRSARLASTYRNLGRCESKERWQKAEQLNVQVLNTSRRTLGVEHPETLSSMQNLAKTYRSQGWCETRSSKMLKRFKKADKLDFQVIETRKRVLGKEHPDTLRDLRNLALSYVDLLDVDEAEKVKMQITEKWGEDK